MTSARSSFSGLRRLRKLICESGAEVIQSWMYFANVLSSLCAKGTGVPVIWGIHASTFEHLGLPSRLCAYAGGRFARHLSDLVINCSTRSAEAHARFGYSTAPAMVIHNGYDPSALFPDEAARDETRRSLGIGHDTFLVGSITRWHSEKDIPTLLLAIEALRHPPIPLRCLLIGPGLDASNAELDSAIREAGLDDTVIPLGARADIAELARALDLHILPSRSEAFPNVVAETMLSGTPNVVTDVGDSALIVGDTGWVVPPSNRVALAGAIEQAWREWADQPDDWQPRRTAARQSIAERFTFTQMAEAYERAWRQVAARAISRDGARAAS